MIKADRWLGLFGVVVVLVLCPTVGQAEDGVIHACAHKLSGDLRIVENPDHCRKSEVAVWWNQVGEPGILDLKVRPAKARIRTSECWRICSVTRLWLTGCPSA